MMLELFLSEPTASLSGNEDAVNARILLFQRLEMVIQSVIASDGYHEARLWLCGTISTISLISPHIQHELFIELLNHGKSSKIIAEQLVRMICEKKPEKAGSVIAKKGYILESFFQGNPRRILQWFDHFASTSEVGHKRGARALSQYVFVNRDTCWEELEWKGRHGQSPAVVATKPHYFHDLDVLMTIKNFLEHVPGFWSSDELSASVKGGEILEIDMHFFIERFVFLMYEKHSNDVWTMVDEFLLEEKFSSLSQRLLILLDEPELLSVLVFLSKFTNKSSVKDFNDPSLWLEVLLSQKNEKIVLNDFILLNALISRGRQLLRLLLDEEHTEAYQEVDKMLLAIKNFGVNNHSYLMIKCMQMDFLVAMKWIALQSWIVHFVLYNECKTKDCCESLFLNNGIKFRSFGGYSFLLPEHEGKSKSSRKKKRKRRYDTDKMVVRDSVDFEMTYQDTDMHSSAISWLLSTDGYSNLWNIADLPDHLSQHCFKIWMKWIFS